MINENTTVDELIEMSKSEDATIRAAVAKFEKTPDSILSEMIDDENEDVLINIAENKNSSVETLTKLFYIARSIKHSKVKTNMVSKSFLFGFIKFENNKTEVFGDKLIAKILSHKNINCKADGEFKIDDYKIRECLLNLEQDEYFKINLGFLKIGLSPYLMLFIMTCIIIADVYFLNK